MLVSLAAVACMLSGGDPADALRNSLLSASPVDVLTLLDTWHLKTPFEDCFTSQSFDGDVLVHSNRELIQAACPQVPLVQWDRLYRRLATALSSTNDDDEGAVQDRTAYPRGRALAESTQTLLDDGYSGVVMRVDECAVIFQDQAIHRSAEGLKVTAPALLVDGDISWSGDSPVDADLTSHASRIAALESGAAGSCTSTQSGFTCDAGGGNDEGSATSTSTLPGYDGFVVRSNQSYLALGEVADVKLIRTGGTDGTEPAAYLTSSLTVNGDLEVEGDLKIQGVSLNELKDMVLSLINCTECDSASSIPSTCLEILQADPSATSGTYTIHPDPLRDPFQVFCDMDTDEGGWTRLITIDVGSQVRHEFWEEWPDDFDYSSDVEPTSTGLYKGSLEAFTEVREWVACTWDGSSQTCAQTAYGELSTMATAAADYGVIASSVDLMNEIRRFYGYEYGDFNGMYYTSVPPCAVSYSTRTTASSYYEGCTQASYLGYDRSDTVLGWGVDITGTSHCWFARGSYGDAYGSSGCLSTEVSGSYWATTWFR